MVEPDRRLRALLRVRLEDGLEPDLWQVGRRTWTGGDVIRVGVSRAPRLGERQPVPMTVLRPAARQARIPPKTFAILRGCAAGQDRRSHTNVGEDLHAPLIQNVSL